MTAYRMPEETRAHIETLAAIMAAAPADIETVLTFVAEIPLPVAASIQTAMPRSVIEAARRCVT